MSIIKTYLEKTTEELEIIENINFLHLEKNNKQKSLDEICLKKTLNIAKNREKFISIKNLEKDLAQYRNYALKQTD